MSTVSPTEEEQLAHRVAELTATDPQFAAARPDPAVAAAVEEQSRLAPLVRTVFDGYAERPALGQRAVEYVTDPATGRTGASLLPRYDTISYGELGERVRAVAAALIAGAVRPGDRVAVLGRAGQPLRALLEIPEPRSGREQPGLRAQILAALEHS